MHARRFAAAFPDFDTMLSLFSPQFDIICQDTGEPLTLAGAIEDDNSLAAQNNFVTSVNPVGGKVISLSYQGDNIAPVEECK